jgi:hypothetical protein
MLIDKSTLKTLLEAEVGGTYSTKTFILAEEAAMRKTPARYYFLYGNTNSVEAMGVILAKHPKTDKPMNFKSASTHFFKLIKNSKNIKFKH